MQDTNTAKNEVRPAIFFFYCRTGPVRFEFETPELDSLNRKDTKELAKTDTDMVHSGVFTESKCLTHTYQHTDI
jgi:hypothetical protein